MKLQDLRRRWPRSVMENGGPPRSGTIQRTVLDAMDPRDPWRNTSGKIAKRTGLTEVQVARALSVLGEKGCIRQGWTSVWHLRRGDAVRWERFNERRDDVRRRQAKRARALLRRLGYVHVAGQLRYYEDETIRLATALARVAHEPLP